ncbi:hypothetical protein BJV78DRAFT_859112 [Lactifluus subvellereus]|nr:hypothetical protein BJV78DRAFT_859112 [Lactifluus subvellereus]
MPTGSAQQMARLYDTQPHTGIVRDAASAPSGAGRGNDAHGASSILEPRFNYATADSSGTGAPTPLHYGQYAMLNAQYGHFGQGTTNYAGSTFTAEQLPDHATNVAYFHPGEYAAPNNGGAPPVWQLFNCWVGYADQDEIHLTIVFRRIPFA